MQSIRRSRVLTIILLMAVEGLDLFFAGLQDLLDGQVFGINIPLIGDQFCGRRPASLKILRDDFIDPFPGPRSRKPSIRMPTCCPICFTCCWVINLICY